MLTNCIFFRIVTLINYSKSWLNYNNKVISRFPKNHNIQTGDHQNTHYCDFINHWKSKLVKWEKSCQIMRPHLTFQKSGSVSKIFWCLYFQKIKKKGESFFLFVDNCFVSKGPHGGHLQDCFFFNMVININIFRGSNTIKLSSRKCWVFILYS